jgi:hypothetical protein
MPPRGSTAAVAKATTARRGGAPRQLTAEYAEGLKAYADILFKGGLTPKGVGRPEAVAALIEIGRDVGLSPTQAIANVKIVNGRPGIFGDAGLALIRASGLLEDFKEFYEGEPGTDEFAAVCVVKRVGAKESRTARFSIGDAKRAELWWYEGQKDNPWKWYPERMLMWRARGFATRDEFQDVLCGLTFVEELEDIPARKVETVTVKTETPAAVPAAIPAAVAVESPTVQVREDDPVKFLSPGPPDESAAAADIGVKIGSGPITEEQVERLVSLRGAIAGAKKIADDSEELDTLWKDLLAGYDVTTAMDLTAEQAHELIEDIIKAVAKWAASPAPKARKRPEPVSAL